MSGDYGDLFGVEDLERYDLDFWERHEPEPPTPPVATVTVTDLITGETTTQEGPAVSD